MYHLIDLVDGVTGLVIGGVGVVGVVGVEGVVEAGGSVDSSGSSTGSNSLESSSGTGTGSGVGLETAAEQLSVGRAVDKNTSVYVLEPAVFAKPPP